MTKKLWTIFKIICLKLSHLPSREDNYKSAFLEEFITTLKKQIVPLKDEITLLRDESKEKHEIIKRYISQRTPKLYQHY